MYSSQYVCIRYNDIIYINAIFDGVLINDRFGFIISECGYNQKYELYFHPLNIAAIQYSIIWGIATSFTWSIWDLSKQEIIR